MPPKKKSPKPRPDDAKQQTRLWLMYPPRLIQQPLIWQLTHKFPVIANIRQASVNDEIGVVCLELDGKRGSHQRRHQVAGKNRGERRTSGDQRD